MNKFHYFDCNDVQPKSVLKSRKSDFDSASEDDEKPPPESSEDSSQPNNIDSVIESNVSVLAFITNHNVEFFMHKTDSMIF